MLAVRASLGKLRSVTVTDAALDLLVILADRFMPNRSFPDKGVDVLEQSVAYAVAHGLTTVDENLARTAVAGMVGMPLDPTTSLAALTDEIVARGLLSPDAEAALLARLQVTLRGLDADRTSPDAVVLLFGAAAAAGQPLAEAVARNLYGRSTAVIGVDLSGMTGDESISSLLGSAPGLVGSERPLPLQELRRAPWQVVVFGGIDGCGATIRETISAALESGSLTDAMDRTLAPQLAAGLTAGAGTFTAKIVNDHPVLERG